MESSVLSATCMSLSSLSDSGTFEEEEAERLYKSEVVGDFEETVCFEHNREIPRKNSQEFWQHTQGLLESDKAHTSWGVFGSCGRESGF